MGKKKQQILHGDPLPLTRKSYLVWVGFSAEGKTNSFIYIKEIFQEESCFMVFSPINFFIDKLFKFIYFIMLAKLELRLLGKVAIV